MSSKFSKIPLPKGIRNIGRFVQIINVLAKHGFWTLINKVDLESGLTHEQIDRAKEIHEKNTSENTLPDERVTLGKRLRLLLEELGPAFIKLGQVMATREDIFPDDVIQELKNLHDNVSPVSFEILKKVLQDELGADRLNKFSEISERPLACGSIGQVHQAKLKNQDVVLKIQRPGVKNSLEQDLSLMEILADLFEKAFPDFSLYQPKVMIEELKSAVLSEINFIREGGNTNKADKNFSLHPEYGIVFPKVVWEFSTEKVLTLHFLERVSQWNKEDLVKNNLNTQLIVERGLKAFLKMVFLDGFFHGDLHPGNLILMRDNQIGIVDCGLMVQLSKSMREHLAGLLIALVKEDFEELTHHFMELSEPRSSFSPEAFEYDIANTIGPYLGLKLGDLKSGKILWEVAKIAVKHKAPFPKPLVLFVKTLAGFESIGNRLAPDLDVMEIYQKFSQEIEKEINTSQLLQEEFKFISRDISRFMRQAPSQLRRILKLASEGQVQIQLKSQDISSLSQSLERSSLRIGISIVIGSLLIGSSILTYSEIGQQYFHMSLIGLIGFLMAGILSLYLFISAIRGRGRF